MWWILTILAAIAFVARDTLIKRIGHHTDIYINNWGRFAFGTPLSIVLLFTQPFPTVPAIFWVYLVLAASFQLLGGLILAKAFQHGQISLSTAITKLSLIFVLIFGIIFLGEKITIFGVVGVLIALLGVYLLNIEKARVSLLEPIRLLGKEKSLRYAVLFAVINVPTILLYKQTVIYSSPYFSAVANYLFAAIIMQIVIFKTSRKHLPYIPRNLSTFIMLGILASIGGIFTNIAYLQVPAAYVEAVVQVDVIFAMVSGALVFKEREKVKEILPGAIIMVLGILILLFAK